MAVKNNNLISLVEIQKAVDSGDLSLRKIRMEQLPDDLSEFSQTVEEHGLHIPKPFEHDLKWWLEKSATEAGLGSKMINVRAEEREHDSRFNEFVPMSAGFGTDVEPSNELLAIYWQKLSESYSYRLGDTEHQSSTPAKELIEDITNMDLYIRKYWTRRTKINDSKYIVVCDCTLLENSYTSNRNLKFLNRTRRIGEIVDLILSPRLKNITKAERPQLYNVPTGIRPDNSMYRFWNGMQVFDLDLKNSPDFDNITDFGAIRDKLFEVLNPYPWLVGIGLSSSGRGIHIYTKVQKPHCLYLDDESNERVSKFWFQMSYIQKYAAIRYVMTHICGIRESNTRSKVIDWSLAKLSHGVKVSYDPEFKLNYNFEDLYPQVGFHVPPVKGLKLEDWILIPDVLEERTYHNWCSQYNDWLNPNFVPETFSSDNFILEDDSLKGVQPFDGEIKYPLRYHVCNTIADLFGEKGRNLAHTILRSDFCHNRPEIDNMFNCSITTHKSATKFGVQILQKCGVKIKLRTEFENTLEDEFEKQVKNLVTKASEKPLKISSDYYRCLNDNEYVGMYVDDVLDHVLSGKANLLVSPPGVGKTEFIKQIAKTKRVCLVLPYISVIDAKIVKDLGVNKLFDVYHGSVSIDKLQKGRSAVMTIDKFSMLDPEKVAYMFDYIAIDESHLIFTSSFRIETMSNALKNIKTFVQLSAFDEYAAKILMMTGTPTGEQPYFNYYNCLNTIHIDKNSSRTKEIRFVFCKDKDEMTANIAIKIAELIKNGKKVLYPTNAGDIQAVKLIGMVEHELQRTVKWGYYKKANADSDMAVAINDSATIKDYELVLASNYLSVGIDINDISDFECVYDDSFAAFEIEQFNCRLRKVNIVSTVYIPLHDNDGNVREQLLNFADFSIRMNREDRDLVRDYMDISNKKMELSMSYDPITNRIYTPGFRVENGQIVFKLEEHELTLFEQRYLDTVHSPFFLSKGMCEYGYKISIEEHTNIEQAIVDDLISIGLENAKLESDIRNQKAINTTNWLLDNDVYKTENGGVIDGLVQRIWKDGIPCNEDPGIPEPQVVTDFIGDIQSITVPSRRIFDEQLWVVQRLLSVYSPETSHFLFDSCITTGGRINKSEVNRYIKLIALIKSEERGSLGEAIHSTITDLYDFVQRFVDDEEFVIDKTDLDNKIDEWTQSYLEYLGLNLRTTKMLSKYRDEVAELVKTLTCKKRTKDSKFKLSFRIVPTPDGRYVKRVEEFHDIILKLFEMSDQQLPDELAHRMRMNHVDNAIKNGVEAVRNIKIKVSELDIEEDDYEPF